MELKPAPAGADFDSAAALDAAGIVLRHRLQDLGSCLGKEDPIRVGLHAHGRAQSPAGAALELSLNWTQHFKTRHASAETWSRLLEAIRRVRAALLEFVPGRAYLFEGVAVHSATLAWGHAFPSTSRTRAAWIPAPGAPAWSVDVASERFDVEVESKQHAAEGGDLAVGISIGRDVRKALARSAAALPRWRATVHVQPVGGPSDTLRLTAGQASALAGHIRKAIRTAHAEYAIRGRTHLFMAGPTGLAFLIGQLSNALGPIQMHELDHTQGAVGTYLPGVLLQEDPAQ